MPFHDGREHEATKRVSRREKWCIRLLAPVILAALYFADVSHTATNENMMLDIEAKVADVKFYPDPTGGHSFTVHYQYELNGTTHECEPHDKFPYSSYLEAKEKAAREYPIGSTRILYVYSGDYLQCMGHGAMKGYSNFASGFFSCCAMFVIFLFIATFVD